MKANICVQISGKAEERPGTDEKGIISKRERENMDRPVLMKARKPYRNWKGKKILW